MYAERASVIAKKANEEHEKKEKEKKEQKAIRKEQRK